MFCSFDRSFDSGPEERETANWSNEKSKREFSSAKRNSNLKGNGRVVLSPASSLSKGMMLICMSLLWLFIQHPHLFVLETEQGFIKLIPSSGFQRWMKMKAWEGLL